MKFTRLAFKYYDITTRLGDCTTQSQDSNQPHTQETNPLFRGVDNHRRDKDKESEVEIHDAGGVRLQFAADALLSFLFSFYEAKE